MKQITEQVGPASISDITSELKRIKLIRQVRMVAKVVGIATNAIVGILDQYILEGMPSMQAEDKVDAVLRAQEARLREALKPEEKAKGKEESPAPAIVREDTKPIEPKSDKSQTRRY